LIEAKFSIGSLENNFAALPDNFYARIRPTPVKSPLLLAFNDALSKELGLSTAHLDASELAQLFSGNVLPEGSEPVAAAYAGHQFGNFVPNLGDGRAILIGEVRDRADQLRDIQLKGSGLTPFSRRGDGRAALGPVLREYLVSEAMHALGIPSTRALAMTLTGEFILREGYVPGAVLTRVAASHIRVGTFEYFAAQGDFDSIRRLVDYVIARHYPTLDAADNKAFSLLQTVIERQAALISKWMMVGFVHGVMNTDNMAISGETIDFGPCAFMEAYHPDTVFSSIDQFGRYAYGRQPSIAQWNLARLGEALLPLISADEQVAIDLATGALSRFASLYGSFWLDGMRLKLGLSRQEDADRDLVHAFLDGLARTGTDFTLAFRRLGETVGAANNEPFLSFVGHDPGFTHWLERYDARLERDGGDRRDRHVRMQRVNPAYIPRNHLVEKAINAAVKEGELEPFRALQTLLSRPFDEADGFEAYMQPAEPSERVYQTFCGT
jgi:serine/tyrosine/threonine adenylyltransferase